MTERSYICPPDDDAGQLHIARRPLEGAALVGTDCNVGLAAVALLRRVYAGTLDPAVAASALAALGFVGSDRRPQRADYVRAEAAAMVALLLQAVNGIAAQPDFVDPLS